MISWYLPAVLNRGFWTHTHGRFFWEKTREVTTFNSYEARGSGRTASCQDNSLTRAHTLRYIFIVIVYTFTHTYTHIDYIYIYHLQIHEIVPDDLMALPLFFWWGQKVAGCLCGRDILAECHLLDLLFLCLAGLSSRYRSAYLGEAGDVDCCGWTNCKLVRLMDKILHQLIGYRLSHYLPGFIHPRWLFGISEPSAVSLKISGGFTPTSFP